MGVLHDDLMALAAFGGQGTGVTRLAWTREHRDAYAWLEGRCRELGLDVEVDPAGNLVARWDAGSGPAVVVASHADTVPRGGRYDGALGVIGGLHAIRLLKERGVVPTRPVWLLAFMDEENARFNTALYGSRAFVGEDLSGLGGRADLTGETLAQAMAAWDRDPDRVAGANRVAEVGHYLELHIEQGPRLEEEGVDIGVVTSIVGLIGYRVRITGQANHAGTTPMGMRRNALAGAARSVLAVREASLARPGTTSNVGVLTASPGSSNVIPGACDLTIDLRAPDDATLAELDAAVRDDLERIAAEEGLGVAFETAYRIPAAPMDPALVDLVARAAAEEEATAVRMPSGAGHDAMVLARHVPTGMIFVPSRDGVSHSPDEHTSPEHCELGARVLARALQALVSPTA